MKELMLLLDLLFGALLSLFLCLYHLSLMSFSAQLRAYLAFKLLIHHWLPPLCLID